MWHLKNLLLVSNVKAACCSLLTNKSLGMKIAIIIPVGNSKYFSLDSGA